MELCFLSNHFSNFQDNLIFQKWRTKIWILKKWIFKLCVWLNLIIELDIFNFNEIIFSFRWASENSYEMIQYFRKEEKFEF